MEYCDQKADDRPTQFDRVVDSDVSKDLSDRLQRLPAAQQNAVRMFYIEECSLAEISDKMDAPINTVKSWVRRGVANLRSEFDDKAIHEFI